MNYKMVLYVLGRLLIVMGALMCLPLFLSVLYDENAIIGFLVAVLLYFILGCAAGLKKPKKTEFYAKEGLVIVGLAWILTSLIGALPYVISGEIPSYVDAFFEIVSGFTTTGASILTDIESLSRSGLFWRSFTHWIGGMGVLVFVLAILPKSNASQSIHIMRAESPGPQVGKLVSRMRNTARILYAIYFFLTILEVICLLLAGMSFFDSLLTAFGTAGTGGFSVKNASIAAYDSPLIEWIIAGFMIVFGINFTLFYLILTGNLLQSLKSEEMHWYMALIFLATLVITCNILPLYDSFHHAVRDAVFQVSAIITTTGFVTADFGKWPILARTVLVCLMFVGACAGSTGGGIKVSRIIIVVKSAFRELRRQVNPRSVCPIRLEGKLVEEPMFMGVLSYLSIYAILFAASQILLCLEQDISFTTCFTAVATCINNVGPGLDAVGPVENFAHFSPFSKMILAVNMLAGRLELFPILALFIPRTWKRR